MLFAIRTVRCRLCLDLIVRIAHRLHTGVTEWLAIETTVGVRVSAICVELRVAQVLVGGGTHSRRASTGAWTRGAAAAGINNVAAAGIRRRFTACVAFSRCRAKVKRVRGTAATIANRDITIRASIICCRRIVVGRIAVLLYIFLVFFT
jgi:hypothetical protein